MPVLHWRSANHADRRALPDFVCTQDPVRDTVTRKPTHPRMWEYKVQGALRTQRPPAKPPRYLLVGEDSHGLGAVVMYEEDGGADLVFLQAAAVHLRFRNLGGEIADELCRELLDRIVERAVQAETRTVKVTARIDLRNRPSRAMATRAGFGESTVHDAELHAANLSQWSLEIVTPVLGDEYELDLHG